MNQGAINKDSLAKLEGHSLLGRIFASALANEKNSREVTKESIEETGRAVAHNLENTCRHWEPSQRSHLC